jgi:hypothetical protein
MPAGMLAVRTGDVVWPGRTGPDGSERDGALLVAGTAGLRSGDAALFCAPLVAAPVLIRRDGRVQARGHLAEHVRLGLMERHLPAGLVEQLCVRYQVAEVRLRRLSAPMAVRCVLAMTLLPHADYREVMATVAGRLVDVPWATPWQLPGREVLGDWRKRLGSKLFEQLFWRVTDRVADEHATAGAGRAGIYVNGLLVCALDGFQLRVPDTAANRKAFGSAGTADDSAPFPLLRAVVATACGSRATLGAAVAGSAVGEQTLTRRLARRHGAVFAGGRLYLCDRNFLGFKLIGEILRCGAHLLMRLKAGIALPRIADWLPDGSYRSRLGGPDGIEVRVVEYDVPGGQETFCLVTDLLDHRAYPADVLAELYPHRWEGSETHIREDKSTITDAGPSRGPILRSMTPGLVHQEFWAWLAATNLLRATGRQAIAGSTVQAREVSLTATGREVLRGLAASSATATTSAAGLQAAARQASTAILAQLLQTDRYRHRERVTKHRQQFPSAKGRVPTTKGKPNIILHAPAPDTS